MSPCALCKRPEQTTRHHLYPRCQHRRLRRKKEGRDSLLETVPLCPPCHKRVHQIFSEKELAERYNTLQALLDDERIQRWLSWIQGKPLGFRPKTRSWKTRR